MLGGVVRTGEKPALTRLYLYFIYWQNLFSMPNSKY